ncbi:jg6214 [Pararge aegeria aegeria]|uniref:Jg6214 protein n=1 Tax=Pararge aegeria aegeria TaxID=348720 RepID=A0A8S4RMT1_9NEOP|nr:jg6214 [Pararge aegeria aegeria]
MSQVSLTWCGRSFIYTKNRKGPKIEPCGTPIDVADPCDLMSFMQTLAILTMHLYTYNSENRKTLGSQDAGIATAQVNAAFVGERAAKDRGFWNSLYVNVSSAMDVNWLKSS